MFTKKRPEACTWLLFLQNDDTGLLEAYAGYADTLDELKIDVNKTMQQTLNTHTLPNVNLIDPTAIALWKMENDKVPAHVINLEMELLN